MGSPSADQGLGGQRRTPAHESVTALQRVGAYPLTGHTKVISTVPTTSTRALSGAPRRG